jgi:hypothetical protein
LSIFEVIMLLCFGLSWPVSIAKTIRTKEVRGKSPVFLIIICLGYISGIIHKILYSPDWVVYLYGLNLLLVMADCVLYFYYIKKISVSAFEKVNSTER